MALPVVPLAVGIAIGAAAVYLINQNKRSGPKGMIDDARSALGDATHAVTDAAESAAQRAADVGKDIKKSVS